MQVATLRVVHLLWDATQTMAFFEQNASVSNEVRWRSSLPPKLALCFEVKDLAKAHIFLSVLKEKSGISTLIPLMCTMHKPLLKYM